MATNADRPEQPSLRTDQLDYHLPEELIARRPVEPRDAARMLVVRPNDVVEHRKVRDLPEYIRAGDAIVVNDTRVLPARVRGVRADSGGQVEGLVLDAGGEKWRIMLRSNGRLRVGQTITLLDRLGRPSLHELELLDRDGAIWIAASTGSESLDVCGLTPLPPYILRARQGEGGSDWSEEQDRTWYQTVFAGGEGGSVAAPTAGLHFTADLLARLASQGVERVEVTLHVGPGTFKPVTARTLAEHEMHSECYWASPGAVSSLREVRKLGGAVYAVGTTTVRVLESLPADLSQCQSGVSGSTDLLISPGHVWQHTDGLMTNFHLPRSTLLALVAAKIGLGRTMSIYAEAIAHGYRFYSYGDAMLILPGCAN